MDCNKQSIGYLCASRTSLECCGFSNLDTGSFPLAVAHPVWSRFWSFEVIILACTKVWEVSWKPPMDCDAQIIKLSGVVVLFPHFFWENWTFFAIFLEKNCCFDTGLLWLFLAYGWYADVGKVVDFEMCLLRCCGFSNLDTDSSCHSSSSVIALLVVWSDHLSVCKDLRSFVEASDKFRRSLRWIAIYKKVNCLGWLSYFLIFLGKLDLFCHFFGKNRGFGWLFLLFYGYNYFRRNIPLNLMKTSGADLTCSTLIPMPRQRQVVLFCQQWPQSHGGMD